MKSFEKEESKGENTALQRQATNRVASLHHQRWGN